MSTTAVPITPVLEPVSAPAGIAGVISTIEDGAAKYAPSILAGILGVEAAVKNTVPGSTKKQIVLSIVTTAARTAEQVPNKTVIAIGGMIDMFVSLLNAAGLFGKAVPPAA